MANLLSLTGICKSYGASEPVLGGVTLGLDEGAKVGLVGANGAGKSTLLRIAAGVELPDKGQVAVRRGTRMALLDQVPSLPPGTVRAALEAPFAELRATIAAYESAAAAQQEQAEGLLEEIELLGGWDWGHRIERAAGRLGVGDLDASVEILSGGERKRVALARLLLLDPQLLLLDEPTNHLDTDTVGWLESWLSQTSAAVLLVTHDRYFLDNVVGRMIELRGGELRSYPGNYTDYVGARALEEARRARSRHRQLKLLMNELEWARRSPPARTSKSRARLDRIADVQDEVRRLSALPLEPDFAFNEAPRLGKTILEVADVSFAWPGGPPLLEGLSFALHAGQRLGLIGPNGAGKTTLLRILTGALEPATGAVRRGLNTRLAYFDQHRSRLEPGRLASQTVRATVCPEGDFVYPGGRRVHVGAWLDRFGFSTQSLEQPVATLSGGERNRLAIAAFLVEQGEANVLLLDEPTNDLDITTLNVLEEALLRFSGCVVVVTHDRYFLDKIATGLLAFEGPGTVTHVPGGYSYYRDHRLKALLADRAAAARARASAEKAARRAARAPQLAPAVGLSRVEQRELRDLETEIDRLEGQVAERQGALAEDGVWRIPDRARALQQALTTLEAELTRAMLRWETLAERA